ncbi:MAG: hypothetical protein HEQ39_16140 [Rhizobacter sp.]
MTISDRTETFFGKTVVDYESGKPVQSSPNMVYRLSLDYDAEQSMPELLEEFLGAVDKSSLEALVIGAWGEPHDAGPNEVLTLLIKNAAELPQLKALFVGDMTYEECEISWIIQGNYQAFLETFPKLEALRIRGSTSLELPAFSHAALRQLVIECGGLPKEIMQNLAASSLPALEHLELWIGTSGYGFDGDVALVGQVVNKLRTPALRYLGLRDAEIADEIAQWLSTETWLETLETLDLSLGTISDIGGQALCNAPQLSKLQRLDLTHHYISDAVQGQLRSAFPHVVLDDPQTPDDEDRYVAVGE